MLQARIWFSSVLGILSSVARQVMQFILASLNQLRQQLHPPSMQTTASCLFGFTSSFMCASLILAASRYLLASWKFFCWQQNTPSSSEVSATYKSSTVSLSWISKADRRQVSAWAFIYSSSSVVALVFFVNIQGFNLSLCRAPSSLKNLLFMTRHEDGDSKMALFSHMVSPVLNFLIASSLVSGMTPQILPQASNILHCFQTGRFALAAATRFSLMLVLEAGMLPLANSIREETRFIQILGISDSITLLNLKQVYWAECSQFSALSGYPQRSWLSARIMNSTKALQQYSVPLAPFSQQKSPSLPNTWAFSCSLPVSLLRVIILWALSEQFL